MCISHLLCANDFLIFCDASMDQLWYLKNILVWFEIVLGLCVNLRKSEMFLVGGGVDTNILADARGCKAGSFPCIWAFL